MKLLATSLLLAVFATIGLMGLLQKRPRAMKLGNIIPMWDGDKNCLWL